MAKVDADLRKRLPFPGSESPVERDILTLLRYFTNGPLTFREVRRELLRSYSESRIQEAILALLDKGLIETAYPCGLEIGFRPLKSEKWFFSRPGVVEKWNPG